MSQSSSQYLSYEEQFYNLDAPTYFHQDQESSPTLKSRFVATVERISAGIERLFPARQQDNWFNDAHSQAMAEKLRIENSACYIRNQIKGCTSLKYSKTIKNMIKNFEAQYGANKPQVIGWVDSLRLELMNRENKIINDL